MNHVRIVVVVLFVVAAVPLTTFAQREAPKQPSIDETRVLKLEQEVKTLRQMNDSNSALIEMLMVQGRENMAILATVRNQTEFQTKLLTVLSSKESKWTDEATLGVAILGLFIAFLVWRINKQIAWFTGSMETHSTRSLMLKATEQNLTLKWWDPLANGPEKKWPIEETAKHDEKIDDLTTMYFGVPLQKRTKHSCFARLKVWWRSTWDSITVCAKGSSVKQTPSSKSPEVKDRPNHSVSTDPEN